MKKMCSIVVSVYNEEKNIIPVVQAISEEMKTINDFEYEIILVNDGSSDDSLHIISSCVKKNQCIKAISLSRNFGHEYAMIAGIDSASGDAIICMDADLQHPPSCIKKMLSEFSNGADVINMVRIRYDEKVRIAKKIFSKLFYIFLNKISPVKIEENASDFFLISKPVAEVLRTNMRERCRFLRAFIQIVGFNKTTLQYEANARLSGESKYSFGKLVKLSLMAILSFSNMPLRLGIALGGITGLFGILVIVYSVIVKIFFETPYSGYTTIIVLISLLFSVQFFLIGIIGEYIGSIFTEVKQRPLYIIQHYMGFNKE